MGGGQNFHCTLLAALDDFLLTGQGAGALLCLLNDIFRLDAGIFHNLLAVIHDFLALAHFIGEIVAHLINDIAHTIHVDHALGGGKRYSRTRFQCFFHQFQQFFNVHASSPLS